MNDGIVASDRAGYFSVGGALGRAFGLFGGEIGKYLLLAALLLSPTVIYALFFAPPAAAPVAALQKGLWATYQRGFLVGVAQFILSLALQATVLYGAFQQMQGQSFDIARSLKSGFERMPAVIGVTILFGLACGFGALLLIVPGLMLLCAFYVAVPVCVIERLGVVESLSRSRALTKGSRWKIFGILLLVGVVGAIVGGGVTLIAARAGGPKVVAVAGYVWQVVSGGFGAVLVAVVYHDLRTSQDGIDVGQIASVFD